MGYNQSHFTDGPVAQLGARLNGIQEVTSSILVRSTNYINNLVDCAGLCEFRMILAQPSRDIPANPFGQGDHLASPPSRT